MNLVKLLAEYSPVPLFDEGEVDAAFYQQVKEEIGVGSRQKSANK